MGTRKVSLTLTEGQYKWLRDLMEATAALDEHSYREADAIFQQMKEQEVETNGTI